MEGVWTALSFLLSGVAFYFSVVAFAVLGIAILSLITICRSRR